MSSSFLSGHKHGNVHHLSLLSLSNLVCAKLVQFGFQPLLLLGGQFWHVDSMLHIRMTERRSAVIDGFLVNRRSGSLEISLGRGILSWGSTGDRVSPLHARHLLGRRGAAQLRLGLRSLVLGKILLICVFLHNVTCPGNHELLMRRTETSHSGNHGSVASSARKLPRQVFRDSADRVGLLEFGNSWRGKNTGRRAGDGTASGKPILVGTRRTFGRVRSIAC